MQAPLIKLNPIGQVLILHDWNYLLKNILIFIIDKEVFPILSDPTHAHNTMS